MFTYGFAEVNKRPNFHCFSIAIKTLLTLILVSTNSWRLNDMSWVLKASYCQLLSSTYLLYLLQLSFLNVFLFQSSKTGQEVPMSRFLHALHHLEAGGAGNSGGMLFLTTVPSVCSCMHLCSSVLLWLNNNWYFSPPLMKLICCTLLWCHIITEAFRLCFFSSKLRSIRYWFNIVC